MVKIAITGNIAAGKSEVEKILSDKGYEVYDTDKFTHQILESSIEVKETFKNYDVFENGAVSRKKLGALVFQNPELKQKLEKIIHPKIKKIIENIRADKPVFISVPLLFEAGMKDLFDYTIFISADESLRLERLMKRNGFTKEEALLRIKWQEGEENKIKNSDFVIYNDKTLKDLNDNINNILKELKEN